MKVGEINMKKKILLAIIPTIALMAGCSGNHSIEKPQNTFLEDTEVHSEIFGGFESNGFELKTKRNTRSEADYAKPGIAVQFKSYTADLDEEPGEESYYAVRYVAGIVSLSVEAHWTRAVTDDDDPNLKGLKNDIVVTKAYTGVKSGSTEYTPATLFPEQGFNYFVIYSLYNIPVAYADAYMMAYLTLTDETGETSYRPVSSNVLITQVGGTGDRFSVDSEDKAFLRGVVEGSGSNVTISADIATKDPDLNYASFTRDFKEDDSFYIFKRGENLDLFNIVGYSGISMEHIEEYLVNDSGKIKLKGDFRGIFSCGKDNNVYCEEQISVTASIAGGAYTPVTDIKVHSDNKAEYRIYLEKDQTIQMKNWDTNLIFNEDNTDKGTTYTAPLSTYYNFFFARTDNKLYIQPEKYYLVGTIQGNNKWTSKDYRLIYNHSSHATEFMLEAPIVLKENDELKIKTFEPTEVWYPADGGNYNVTATSGFNVYFTPNGGHTDWYYGYFSVQQIPSSLIVSTSDNWASESYHLNTSYDDDNVYFTVDLSAGDILYFNMATIGASNQWRHFNDINPSCDVITSGKLIDNGDYDHNIKVATTGTYEFTASRYGGSPNITVTYSA